MEEAINTLYLKSMEQYYGNSPFIVRDIFEENWAGITIISSATDKFKFIQEES